MMKPPTHNVLVVGAGPTGLTAALELARQGLSPRIIDCDDGPTALSKAVGISPRSLDLLEPSGVTGRLLATGVRVQRAHLHFGDVELCTVDLGVLDHRFDFLLSLPQRDTETLMASVLELSGVRIEWNTRLIWLETTTNGIEAELDGPRGREFCCCTHVFGADGAQSAVRDVLGLGFDGYTHRRTWSIADCALRDWFYDAHSAHVFLHLNGDIGFIVPLGGDRFRAISNTHDAISRIPGALRCARALRTDTFRIPIRQAGTYQKGNVFLGGDAAHVQSPVGARGMNLGIEDAACFVRHLVEGTLAGYTAERRQVGCEWIRLSERVLRIAQMEGPVRTKLRNLGLRMVGHLPALQKSALERVAGLRE